MNRFPFELLSKVGLFLDVNNLKTCSLVCKSWKRPFQTLLFQKVSITNKQQIQSYLRQESSLKQSTHHFELHEHHFTDEQFEQLAQTSPNVNTLRLVCTTPGYFRRESKIVSVIQRYWSKNLTSINASGTILGELFTFLSQQLQEVTGDDFSCFYGKDQRLIFMPQLKQLRIIHNDYDHNTYLMSLKHLNDMRIAYPNLQELVLRSFTFILTENDKFTCTPFPFVRQLKLDACKSCEYFYSQAYKMFPMLTTFTSIGDQVSRDFLLSPTPYYDFFTNTPNIHHLHMTSYIPGTSQNYEFPSLKMLSHLTTLHLSWSFQFLQDDFVGIDFQEGKRELLDLDFLLTSVPTIRSLQLNGPFHLVTGESFGNYFSSCDVIDDNGDVGGHNEELRKFRASIVFVKKKKPEILRLEPIPIYHWKEINNTDTMSVFANEKVPKRTVISHPLKKLTLARNTLRNPTYKWIAQNLPFLEELGLFVTEPYPFCDIVLGKNIHTLQIYFGGRYRKYGTPLIRLKNFITQQEITVAWIPERKSFETIIVDDIKLIYAVSITYQSALKRFDIDRHSIMDVLNKMK